MLFLVLPKKYNDHSLPFEIVLMEFENAILKKRYAASESNFKNGYIFF